MLGILCLAFLLRAGFATFYWKDKPLTIDMKEYILLGKNVAQGQGYNYGEEETSGTEHYSRPPLYPFFLAGIFSIFGVNLNVVRVIQSLLGALNCLFLYIIARRIFSSRLGIIAALIAAFYLPFIWFSAHILSEILFITLFLVAIIFLLSKNSPAKSIFLSGIFLGLSTLCRPVTLFFLPFALFWLAFVYKNSFSKIIKVSAALLLGFIIILMPWIVRNYLTFGQFVLVHSSGGVTFWLSNHPLSLGDGDLAANPQLKAAHKEFLKNYAGYSREELDRIYFKEAFSYIKAHPLQIVVLDLKKLFYFWIPIGPSMEIFSFRHKLVSYISYFPLLIFSIIGIYLSRSLWKENLLLYFILACFTLSIMVFYPQERFRIPVIDPCLIVFASCTLSAIITRERFR